MIKLKVTFLLSPSFFSSFGFAIRLVQAGYNKIRNDFLQ